MKKLLGLILVLTMVLALATTAFAASDCVISIGGATVKAGDEISLPISVKNSPGIAAAAFVIEYDSDVMTYTGVDLADGEFMAFGSENAGTNPVKVAAINLSLSNISGNFSFAYVNFKVNENAAAGTYDIKLSLDGVHNYDEENVPATAKSSTLVVCEPGPGDVDLDCFVTIRDAARILQHIAGWGVEIDEDFADVDGSGTITIRDAALILQYIAGWNVTLGSG